MPKLVLTPEIEDAILDDVSEGIPLAESCRTHDVGRTTIYDRRDADTAFAERLARARELGEEAIAESTLAIADDGRNDWVERHGDDDKNAGWHLNGEHVQRSKLRVDTRLKLLAVWNPTKYGSKVDVTSAGEKLAMDDVTKFSRLASIFAQQAADREAD